ncbi:MFS transporter [Aeromicrobium sp. Root472D3]|uniref:MFS transporter n=1 Tax=Aeromicrobium sp. Root472D3 TaxID=1736540 RepID=UPI0006FAB6CC|nr:MFS transporter [Aeromicrobium sp. Root472D3]KQX75214.1 MFS transporter [Aeromicrobium sp. Root472D3]
MNPGPDPVQRRIVSVLVVVQVVGGVGNGAGLAVGGLLIKDITGSSGWSGMAVVMLTLGAAAFTIPLSSLAARRGRRPALTLGWLSGAAGALVTVVGSETRSLPVALLGLLLFGGSTAANLQSRFAAVDRAAPAQVGRSLSVVVWSTTVGAVIGPNLTGPGAAVADALGLPDLSGPMLFSATGFAVAGLLTVVLLRPDPLVARAAGQAPAARGVRAALPHVRGRTLTAIWAIASSHAVMVAVMALTPVHMEDHGASLEIIGLTISLHIAGMYALSPVMGWLADAWGQDRTILLGQSVLLLAAGVAGTSGESQVQITIGLVLLGIGWSASVIAGAAALTTSVDPSARPLVQGFSDLAMNLAGASGGLLAGLVVALSGFGTLNAAAAVLVVPVVVLVLSGRRVAARTADAASAAGS